MNDVANIYTDVLIIGAGPIGLFAAFACEMHGLKAHIVDSMSVAGGQCTAFYPDKIIYDIPGFIGITGQKFIENLIQQTKTMNIPITLNTNITQITEKNLIYAVTLKNLQKQKLQEYSTARAPQNTTMDKIDSGDEYSSDTSKNEYTLTPDVSQNTDIHATNAHTYLTDHSHQMTNFNTVHTHADLHITEDAINPTNNELQMFNLVATSSQYAFHAKYIILATGAGGFDHNKLIAKQIGLSQDEMLQLEQTHLFYALPKQMSGKTVVILGGGDTALDYALTASQSAAKVYIIHRRSTFSGLTHTLQQLQKLENVYFLTDTILKKIAPVSQDHIATDSKIHDDTYSNKQHDMNANTHQFGAITTNQHDATCTANHYDDTIDNNTINTAPQYTTQPDNIASTNHIHHQITLHLHSTQSQHSMEMTLEADYIIPCYGFKHANTSLLHPNIQTSAGKILVDADTYQTHVTNVYCVGDASYYPNKSKLFSIARGFGEVASLF